jgi:hypothetical protein
MEESSSGLQRRDVERAVFKSTAIPKKSILGTHQMNLSIDREPFTGELSPCPEHVSRRPGEGQAGGARSQAELRSRIIKFAGGEEAVSIVDAVRR